MTADEARLMASYISAVLVDDAGRIAAVGPDIRVASPPDATRRTFADGILVPGLVNTHTHLELSGLRDRVATVDFADWIRGVRALKQSTDAAAYREAAQQGLRETWRYGATTVADTGTSGATVYALSESGGRGIYYHEAIAPEPGRAGEAMAALEDAVRRLQEAATDGITIGVSPHAPYTVSPPLYRDVVVWARREGLRLAAHVAESRAETELLTAGRGPFAGMWRRRGIVLPDVSRSAVAFLDRLGVFAPDLLAIHLVEADERDLRLLAERGVAVASCPRSNERHGHGSPPLGRMLELGLRVGLGTDSLASVESLDMVAEARAAMRAAPIGPERAVRLITVDAACALGCEDSIGTLEPGKWGDMCVIEGPPPIVTEPKTVAEAVLEARPEGVLATYVGGREVFVREASTPPIAMC
jgi:5-methylthioadenosine/S-adenosylhomocysteine deaminase